MNCESYKQLIDYLVEGELEEQNAEKVSSHILDCQNCFAHFEMLEREKSMYSHYLFEVEPSVDLSARFQTKLETAETQMIPAVNMSFFSAIFAFLQSKPALAAFTLLIFSAVGFSLFNLFKETQTFEKISASQNYESFRMMLPPIKKDLLIVSDERKNEGKNMDEIVRNDKQKNKISSDLNAVKHGSKKKEVVTAFVIDPPKLTEEEQQFKLIQSLELETAKQIEKVEILLRAFRNTRFVEGSELYDISYEKQQARKLLQNNFALKQKAENYGLPFAEEMLGKVEPYLLDIANLDINPAPEQVLEIKERVKNQNIIASLQGF